MTRRLREITRERLQGRAWHYQGSQGSTRERLQWEGVNLGRHVHAGGGGPPDEGTAGGRGRALAPDSTITTTITIFRHHIIPGRLRAEFVVRVESLAEVALAQARLVAAARVKAIAHDTDLA